MLVKHKIILSWSYLKGIELTLSAPKGSVLCLLLYNTCFNTIYNFIDEYAPFIIVFQ